MSPLVNDPASGTRIPHVVAPTTKDRAPGDGASGTVSPILDEEANKNTAAQRVRSQTAELLSVYTQFNFYGESPGHLERRRATRYPFPQPVILTPVDDDGQTPLSDRIVTIGKQISSGGIGIYHPAPLPFRRVIASVEAAPGRWYAFLLELTWCRFTHYGWYESGGRFLWTVPSPMACVGDRQQTDAPLTGADSAPN